jgi:hypothetical protein
MRRVQLASSSCPPNCKRSPSFPAACSRSREGLLNVNCPQFVRASPQAKDDAECCNRGRHVFRIRLFPCPCERSSWSSKSVRDAAPTQLFFSSAPGATSSWVIRRFRWKFPRMPHFAAAFHQRLRRLRSRRKSKRGPAGACSRLTCSFRRVLARRNRVIFFPLAAYRGDPNARITTAAARDLPGPVC